MQPVGELWRATPWHTCEPVKQIAFVWKVLEAWDALDQEITGTNQYPPSTF